MSGSSTGQILGGVVGAVAGFIVGGPVGGPVGALQGLSLGYSIGGALDPPKGPTVEGPRLQDKGVQTSTYGASIPRVYGTIAGSGNIIQIENNQLKETVRKKSSGGKGGGSSTTTRTYSYSATFQLSLCEGQIAGVRRIWCGDKLIYNAGSDDLETIIASNQAAEGFRVYLGTDDQLPDSRYEAEYGVGNVSAHRGEAYIAFYDFQLADYSNTLQAAQFKVEVVTQSTIVPIQETNRVTLPTGAIRFPGNPLLISGEGYGYVCTSESNPLIYRVSPSGTLLAADLTSGGWSISSGSLVNNKISISSRLPSWAAWSSPVTRINGTDYPVAPSSARRIAITPGGRIYSCGTTADPVVINSVGLIGPVVVYSANIEPTFERQVQALIADGNHVYVLTSQATAGSKITKLSDDGSSLSFDIEVSGTHDSGDFRVTDDDDFLYLSGGNVSTDQVRITIIRKSDLSVVSTSVYSVAEFPALTEGAFRRVTYGFDRLLSTITEENGFPELVTYKINTSTSDLQLLSSIIQSEVDRSSLISSSDISTGLLVDSVRGYRVGGGALRAAIEPLQAAFPFDVRQHGYQIQFLPRGQASVVTIPWEDLGAAGGDTPGDILKQSREMDSQLPARTTIKYLDAAREYAIAEQYSERLNTEAINRVDMEFALVLTANEAAGIVEVLNFLPWLERTPALFTLPQKYRYLEPGDVVTVELPTATYELRLTEVNEASDGRLDCKAKPNRAALYTPAATGAEGVPPTGAIQLAGESLFVPLDIPVVDETLQDAAGFVGVMTGYNAGWTGALAVRSNDGGQTWADLQAYTGKASIGTARGTLPASDSTLIDQRTLTVDMISGAPESITRDQMLAGANYAAYGIDGRWEIVRFQNATLQTDGGYLLGGFVRGEKGTEWATGLHAIGDYFVLLDDPDNAFIGAPVESIALERLYRGVTSGASIDSAADVPFTYRGVNLECLSPAYAKGVRDGSSNFTGTFTRRSRLSSSWWATGVVAPVGEANESYEVDVMNGSTIVRTITASTPTFAYSAANQTTDFGSTQASIAFRIYQLSATVGRGYPLEVTL